MKKTINTTHCIRENHSPHYSVSPLSFSVSDHTYISATIRVYCWSILIEIFLTLNVYIQTRFKIDYTDTIPCSLHPRWRNVIFLFDVSVYSVGARFCFGQSKVYRRSGWNTSSSEVYFIKRGKVVFLIRSFKI